MTIIAFKHLCKAKNGGIEANPTIKIEEAEDFLKQFCQKTNLFGLIFRDDRGKNREQLSSDIQSDESAFSEEQRLTLERVYLSFKGFSSVKTSEMSHKETAWQKNTGNRTLIDYAFAFDLVNPPFE